MKFNAKNKTLIIVTLVFILNSLIFGFLFYKKSQDEFLETKEVNFQKIKASFFKNIQFYYNDYYIDKANTLLTNEIINLVQTNQKDELYEKLLTLFNLLKQERGLEQLHFHLKDGTTLLRMHNKELFGDDVVSLRPMIKTLHAEQKIVYGFEEGLSGLSYRIAIPIFKNNDYLGAIEFGLSTEMLLNLVSKFNDISGVLYFDNLNRTHKQMQYAKLTDDIYQPLLTRIETLENNEQIKINNNLIGIYSFKLQNFSKENIGEFIFFDNLTKYQEKFEKEVFDFILIRVLTLAIMLYIINYGFNLVLNELQSSYNQIKKYSKLVEQYVITSSTDLEGNITSVSEAFCEISGYTKEELIAQNHRIIKHPDMPKELFEEMWETISQNKVWQGEIKNLRKDGTFYWVYANISSVYDDNGNKTGYTAIRQNITDKKKLEEISITDGLTHIYNRRYFNDIFPKLLSSSKRNDNLICFLLMDIDYFKQYNDNYGHQMGDEVLIKFAQCLNENTKRSDDMAFRLGGEEFGIIFKAQDKEKAFEFALHIKQSIASMKIPHNYSSVNAYITASMGLVCEKGLEIHELDTIYKQADDLLYKSKHQGRNTITMNR